MNYISHTNMNITMTDVYHIPAQIQIENNIETVIFGLDSPNSLNHKEKSPLNYFGKLKVLRSIASYKLKGKGQCIIVVLNYLMDNAHNETGICYHSQERIRQYTGFSKQQIIDSIKTLIQTGFLFKQRRGRCVTNMYKINYELIEDPEMKSTINKFNYKSYPRKPRRTYPILEVNSEHTLTTNSEDLKERSINTNSKNNTSFSNYDSKEKEEVPIKMHSEWIPKYQTHKNLAKCLGVTDEFVEDETIAFRKSVMDPENDFYDQEKFPKEWNGIFYGHCKKSLEHYTTYGSRAIKFNKRLTFYETHEKKPLIEPKEEARPTIYTIANTQIEYEDMRSKSTPEEEEELEADLAAWYDKMGTKPPS